jgi:hypothetical protein
MKPVGPVLPSGMSLNISTLVSYTLFQPFDHGPSLEYMNSTASSNGALNLWNIQNRHVKCTRKRTHNTPLFVSTRDVSVFASKFIAFSSVLLNKRPAQVYDPKSTCLSTYKQFVLNSLCGFSLRFRILSPLNNTSRKHTRQGLCVQFFVWHKKATNCTRP